MSHTSRPDEASREKRRQLYRAGEPLFERFGFRKTTVEDICRAARMSKRTFYELFADKADFFAHMILAVAEDQVDGWVKSLPHGLTPPEKIESFIEFYVSVIITRPIFGILTQDPNFIASFGALGGEMKLSPLIDTIREVIEDGIRQGYFRRMDTDTAVWILMSLLDSMYILLPEYFPGAAEELHRDSLTKEVKDFILGGLERRR